MREHAAVEHVTWISALTRMLIDCTRSCWLIRRRCLRYRFALMKLSITVRYCSWTIGILVMLSTLYVIRAAIFASITNFNLNSNLWVGPGFGTIGPVPVRFDVIEFFSSRTGPIEPGNFFSKCYFSNLPNSGWVYVSILFVYYCSIL